jgi:hypothetical protein
MRAGALALLGFGACAPPPSDSAAADPCAGEAAPQSIDAVVEHLNTLPRPVTAPCVVRSLARPLRVEATADPLSAQPADGPDSPRFFLHVGPVRIAVVGTGDGAKVIEFGEATDDLHTIKGELPMPITTELSAEDPHDEIADAQYGTGCAICHVEQEALPGGGWSSIVIRPEDDSLVDLGGLARDAASCAGDPDPGDDRCALLIAIFEGEVVHTPFPTRYPTLVELAEAGPFE